jgi:predicted RNase H-like nuclease
MFYEGAWRLLSAGICVPRLNETKSSRIAVEAYPGLAVSRMGERYYKNDKPHSMQANSLARRRILAALKSDEARHFGVRLKVASKDLEAPMNEAGGDWLDAVICAMQAAAAWKAHGAGFGLPAQVDPCEGWIVSA